MSERPIIVLFLLALTMGGCGGRSDFPPPPPSGDDAANRPATPQQGQGPIAFVTFADSITAEDQKWLRDEGFEIVRIFPESASATVRVPALYEKDPMKENPRITRFDVQYR